MTERLTRLIHLDDDGGNAIIEFVFVAILVLVPLIYLIVAVAVVQRARLATTNAARDVGRAIATANSLDQADGRAQAALRIAIANQGLQPSQVQLRYVAPGADCQNGPAVTPALTAGAQFQVCVIRHQQLPAVPSIVSGRGIVAVGRYLVHIDDFRTIR
ncbi:MAG: pilus assembly protein [Actinomycetota bacterium]|nr:pilus assembly protein [Actinomycetota bacterium]